MGSSPAKASRPLPRESRGSRHQYASTTCLLQFGRNGRSKSSRPAGLHKLEPGGGRHTLGVGIGGDDDAFFFDLAPEAALVQGWPTIASAGSLVAGAEALGQQLGRKRSNSGSCCVAASSAATLMVPSVERPRPAGVLCGSGRCLPWPPVKSRLPGPGRRGDRDRPGAGISVTARKDAQLQNVAGAESVLSVKNPEYGGLDQRRPGRPDTSG